MHGCHDGINDSRKLKAQSFRGSNDKKITPSSMINGQMVKKLFGDIRYRHKHDDKISHVF
jgi:hypothetical protein